MEKKKKINYENLTRKEAEYIAKRIRALTKEIVGKEHGYIVDKFAKNYANNILFTAISEKIKAKREKRNLTIKKISTELKIPQYKIRYIENASLSNIEKGYLEKYLYFLDLTQYYSKWAKKHKDIVDKYNLPTIEN